MENICFLNSIGFWGGGEKLLLEHAIAFQKKGYNVYLAARQGSPLWEKAKEADLQTFPVSVGNLSFINPFKIARLAGFFKDKQIDTVVFTTSQDVKLGSIAAKLAGLRNIVYLRGLAVPIKASPVNRFVFNSLLTHIISNSEETKRNILLHLGPYMDAGKVHTIYHGIETDKPLGDRPTLPAIQERGKGIILGNAGRLTQQKGQDKLIGIAKELKERKLDFTLFIAGTGELRPELERLIQEHGLTEEVLLLGFVEDMDAFMASIDVFLLTSEWEGFGFVLVEAMLQAKPVVAFDTSSNPEILSDGLTGFLVDFPDLPLFADKVERLAKDGKLRQQMGEAGQAEVMERFRQDDRIRELEVYLLGEARRQ